MSPRRPCRRPGSSLRETRYDETGQLATMKQFLADPERMLERLFAD